MGVKARVARTLEPAALELFPDDPEDVLTSRACFERAAMHTVVGDAGNLELSFGLVDELASTVEKLELARASDVPDPFRRVWIVDEAGDRRQGVVLRCERGEVAVFCPPNHGGFTGTGSLMKVSYRGFSSSVEYELRLNDVVRLPAALVLHLNRPGGAGAIGRKELRLDVHLPGQVRALGAAESIEPTAPLPCEVLDVSVGGLCIASELPYGAGQAVEIALELPDASPEPYRAMASICWNRTDASGRPTQGLKLTGSTEGQAQRYELYLNSLLPSDWVDSSAVASEFVFTAEHEDTHDPRPPASIPLLEADPPPESDPVLDSDPVLGSGPMFDSSTLLDFNPVLGSDPVSGSDPVLDSNPVRNPAPAAPAFEGDRTAPLQARIEALESGLERANRRSSVQRQNIEELLEALAEARALLAVQSNALSRRGETLQDALSLFSTVKETLDALEGRLAPED